MKKYSLFVGIDISKSKLDISMLCDPVGKKNEHLVVTNNMKGIQKLLQFLEHNYVMNEAHIGASVRLCHSLQ